MMRGLKLIEECSWRIDLETRPELATAFPSERRNASIMHPAASDTSQYYWVVRDGQQTIAIGDTDTLEGAVLSIKEIMRQNGWATP